MSGPPALEGGGAWISTRTGRVPDQGTAKTTADTAAVRQPKPWWHEERAI
jgi:hypothetical protein